MTSRQELVAQLRDLGVRAGDVLVADTTIHLAESIAGVLSEWMPNATKRARVLPPGIDRR